MARADKRIVVQGTAREKRKLGALANVAKAAAERAGASIDDALKFVEESNKRIAAMEAAAKRAPSGGTATQHPHESVTIDAHGCELFSLGDKSKCTHTGGEK